MTHPHPQCSSHPEPSFSCQDPNSSTGHLLPPWGPLKPSCATPTACPSMGTWPPGSSTTVERTQGSPGFSCLCCLHPMQQQISRNLHPTPGISGMHPPVSTPTATLGPGFPKFSTPGPPAYMGPVQSYLQGHGKVSPSLPDLMTSASSKPNLTNLLLHAVGNTLWACHLQAWLLAVPISPFAQCLLRFMVQGHEANG